MSNVGGPYDTYGPSPLDKLCDDESRREIIDWYLRYVNDTANHNKDKRLAFAVIVRDLRGYVNPEVEKILAGPAPFSSDMYGLWSDDECAAATYLVENFDKIARRRERVAAGEIVSCVVLPVEEEASERYSSGWNHGADAWVLDAAGNIVPADGIVDDYYTDGAYNDDHNHHGSHKYWEEIPTATHLVLARHIQRSKEHFVVVYTPKGGITPAQLDQIEHIEETGGYMEDAWNLRPEMCRTKERFIQRLMANPFLSEFLSKGKKSWGEMYNDLFSILGHAQEKKYTGAYETFYIAYEHSICTRGRSLPIRRVLIPTPDMPTLCAYVMSERYQGVERISVRLIEEPSEGGE
jgi:hypothetical protein